MAKVKIDNKLVAAVRIRGRVNVRQSIAETMNRLNLKRVNSLSLIYGTKSNVGMINKCKDFITFGEIDRKVLERLLESKGIKVEKDNMDKLMNGAVRAADAGIRLPMGMKPPKRGYKDIKRSFVDKGDLGYRGVEINALIERMI